MEWRRSLRGRARCSAEGGAAADVSAEPAPGPVPPLARFGTCAGEGAAENACGCQLTPADGVGFITLPSLLINMLISIPVYGMMRDLARWVYPPEEYA